MDRSGRLFDIIQLLRRAKNPVTAAAMAEVLEVTPRTVYRDVATLQAMRVPIEGEAGIGYVMRPGFDLPPLMFSTEEIEAIVVGLAMLPRTGDAGLAKAAERVMQKIATVVPAGPRAVLETGALHVSQWTAVPASSIDVSLIRRAIRDEEVLSIVYRDQNGEVTQRFVRPLALIYYVESVLLAAWCETRQDFRHFRTDRMSCVAASGGFFHGKGAGLRQEWHSRHGTLLDWWLCPDTETSWSPGSAELSDHALPEPGDHLRLVPIGEADQWPTRPTPQSEV